MTSHPAALVAMLAFLPRLILVLLSPLIYDNRIIDTYDVIAQNLLSGNGFSYLPAEAVPTATRAPFYPFYLAGVFALVGKRFWALRLLEGLVDVANAVLVYVLVARNVPGGAHSESHGEEEPNRLALLASGVYAVHPFAIYYSVKLGTETWFTFWLLLSLILFLELLRAPGARRAACLGLCLGVLFLNKSVAGLLPPLWVLLAARKGLLARWRLVHTPLALCVAALVVTPWTIRNYRVSGAFVPVQTLTWFNFWLDFGVRPDSFSQEEVSRLYPAWGGHPYNLSASEDVRQEAEFARLAHRWIVENPAGFLRKVLANLVEFWYLVETWSRAKVVLLWELFQIPLAALGFILGIRSRHRWFFQICLATVIYFDLLYSPIYSLFRYSLVVAPIMSIAMANGLPALWRGLALRLPGWIPPCRLGAYRAWRRGLSRDRVAGGSAVLQGG